MITKEQFLEKCTKLFPEYDFSKIEWISYTTPITVTCKEHGDFEILPRKLYQQRGRCEKCKTQIISSKNTANAEKRLAKARKTNLEKYGVENPYQSEEIKAKIRKISMDKYGGIGASSKEIAQKIAATKQERYGNSSFTNRDKCKQTVQDRYGVDNVFALKEVLDKKKQTYLAHYGVDHPLKTQELVERIRKTNQRKYGVSCIFQRPDVVKKSHSKEIIQKQYATKRKNKTFNSSKMEDRCYELLHSLFPTAIHHYTSDVYPFECDMYVPELDLYIECNFFWTHGGHFFDSNNPQDIEKLNRWKSRGSKFYEIAARVWAESDVAKLNCVLKNGLNYLVCWTEEEFISVFFRDFTMHGSFPDKIQNPTQVAKLANWEEYFKREIQLLEDPVILGELFVNRYKYLGKLPHQLTNLELLNGLSISGKLRKYSTFDNCGMKEFITKYRPSEIYDPCAGWGERLLTCHLHKIPYLGVDINPQTVNGLLDLISHYDIKANVLCQDSSQFIGNTFGCLFTCPPYWNTEIYTDVGAENLSYTQFLDWWKTVIRNSNCELVAYQINQRFKQDMNKVITDLGYVFVEEIVLPQRSSHFTRKEGNKKREYESIQIFRIKGTHVR